MATSNASESGSELSLLPPEQRPSVIDFFSRSLIYDEVFALCSPATITRCSKACKDAYLAVQDYTSRTYDINKHLLRFITDPIGFRSLMARTGSVISGSNALQFLDKVFYPDSDLDLYVYAESCREVIEWILLYGGKDYTYTPREDQHEELEEELDEMEEREIERERRRVEKGLVRTRLLFEPVDPDAYHVNWTGGVFTFQSETDESAKGHPLKFQVIVTSGGPLQSILSFHSTVVMNAISAYAAYSFFPYATFEQRRVIAFEGGCPRRREAALMKYAARGYRIMANVFPYERTSQRSPFRTGERLVNDGRTWIIPFSMKDVDIPRSSGDPQGSAIFDPFAFNAWHFSSEVTVLPKLEWYLFHHRALRFQYTATADFQTFIYNHFHSLDGMELSPGGKGKSANRGLIGWRDLDIPARFEDYERSGRPKLNEESEHKPNDHLDAVIEGGLATTFRNMTLE